MNSTSGANRETETEVETETMRAAVAMLSLAEPSSSSSKSNSPSPSSDEAASPLPASNTLSPIINYVSNVYYNTYSLPDSSPVVSVSVSEGLSARNNNNFATHAHNFVTNSARSSIDIDTNPRTSTDTTTNSTTGSTGTSTRRPLPCESCRTQRKRCSTDRPSCVRCREKNILCQYNHLAKKLDPDAQQVSKRALACISCHFKKIKCSMERPECLNCKNRGQICQYFITLSELPPIPPAPIPSSPTTDVVPVNHDYQPPFSGNNSAMSDFHTPMSPLIRTLTSSSLSYAFSPISANELPFEHSNNSTYTMTRAHTTPTPTTITTATSIYEPEPRPSTSSTSSSISYASTTSFTSSASSSIPSVSNQSKYRFSGLRGRSQSVWATVSSALVRNPLSSAPRSSPIPSFSTSNQQQQFPYQVHQYQSQYQKYKTKKDAKLAHAALADLQGVAPNPTNLGALVVSRLPKLATGTQKQLKSGKLWIMNPETGEKGYFCPSCLKEYSTSNGLKYHLAQHNDPTDFPDGYYFRNKAPESIDLLGAFSCLVNGCGKTYNSLGGLKYHQLKVHHHDSSTATAGAIGGGVDSAINDRSDGKEEWRRNGIDMSRDDNGGDVRMDVSDEEYDHEDDVTGVRSSSTLSTSTHADVEMF
ncbi:hypothetical protein HK100_001964 [Physocladia obscura]|uniref:Uncharacterized protein n=1 Tax=Physocladia obscura TaxID=109957 RepID=A0AAD5T223_9FUNG|nr:hypothetical protein HK100_001964 [Physocladia obscura]